ncbi:hypothetical protein XENOCAPTIV_010765, partial [Xenoophorus captivus]
DVLCGKLYCHGGNNEPNYGRMVSVGTCKGSFYDDYTKDYGQVDEGSVCGDGKVLFFLFPGIYTFRCIMRRTP